jgi:hypothetical protein
MRAPTPVSDPEVTGRRRLPVALWLLALVVAVLHIAPTWRAAANTPAGWTFTGNFSVSPDVMQYRVWERQTLEMGPIVDDRLTTEPNQPHLLVLPYWAFAKIGHLLGASPVWVDNYAGCVLAFAFTILLFVVVRRFLPEPRQTWIVFLAILFGGGLGAYLKVLAEIGPLHRSSMFEMFIARPIAEWPMFESYRNIYVVKAILDTHFLLIWIVALATVLALYEAIARYAVWRVAVAVALAMFLTVLHVYEGATIVAIAAGVAGCCWLRRTAVRPALVVAGATTLGVGITYVALMALYRRSGLPLPDWRAVNILVSVLLIGFPVAWVLIAAGGARYWREARLPELFLVGWGAACTIVTLSGPFYPYPDRGAMTMQVAVYVIAGGIWFALRPQPSRRVAVLAVLALVGTPVWAVAANWRYTAFHDDAPYMYQNASHRRVLAALAATATRADVLLADPADVLWLAPDFPGRVYLGHFFLTVDYDRKVADFERFLEAPPDARRAFLERTGTRLLYLRSDLRPERMRDVPGLRPIAQESVGWLFVFDPHASAPSTTGATLGAPSEIK